MRATGGLRQAIAPSWRKLVRLGIVLLGLGVFAIIQWELGSVINKGFWLQIILLMGVGLVITCCIASPIVGFIGLLVLSQYVRLFFTPFLPWSVTIDFYALCLLAVILTLRAIANRHPIRNLHLAEWLLIASYIYAMWIRNPELEPHVYQIQKLVLTACVVYFVARAVITKREHVAWICIALAVVGLSWALMGIYEQYAGNAWFSPLLGGEYMIQGEHDIGAGRSTGPAGQYYVYGNVLILAFLLCLHLAAWTNQKHAKMFYYISCPVILLGLYYGYSRGPYLALAIALIVRFAFEKAHRLQYLVVVVCLALVAVVFAMPKLWSIEAFRQRVEWGPGTRSAINATSLNMIKSNLLFGVGTFNYGKYVPDYVSGREHIRRSTRQGFITMWGRPHNEYALIFAEQGLVGGLLYFGGLLGFIGIAFRARSLLGESDILGRGYAAIVIAFAIGVMVTMATDEFQSWPYMYVVLYTMFAMVVRLLEFRLEDEEANRRRVS
ncbi:MAG: O-antigen ligase family protein [Armatimonadetes bacterium]|nr:O-antigen ligase family protein [Armatimonadota bacterium]